MTPDFLLEMADRVGLTDKEQEVFLKKFSSDKSDLVLAREIHVQDGTLRARLTGVYKKFGIQGSGPVKAQMLLRLLTKEYQKSTATLEGGTPQTDLDIAHLVQAVREKMEPFIQERCRRMRVLDMTQPIDLNDIYTKVNILEKITGRRHKESELLQNYKSDNIDRFGLGGISEKRLPGLDAVEKYTKLMIWGKPGAGKTTFMKYVALQCSNANSLADYVPFFIPLKDFAETDGHPGIIAYLIQHTSGYGVTAAEIDTLMHQGKALILLDGLDEVREKDSARILKEIRAISQQFGKNTFVITCRIAANEYTFDQFTEVEIADFDAEQISAFATHWFKDKLVKAENFLQRLNESKQIRQLAVSPLLLTLLCLTFEEIGDFPANRSELYKEGIDALLKKWDAKRGIYREQIYKKLTIQRKEDLLSKIALTTFKQGDYLFKQNAAERYIADYIRNLPDANADPEALQVDSEEVLQSIEAQHGLLIARARGIYSFSHRTFHEYFAAREIVFSTQPLHEKLKNLGKHFLEERWREVWLLAVGMSPSADDLLLMMKEQTDGLVAADETIQQFLMWVNQKALSVKIPFYKPAAIRAFYFALDRSFIQSLVPTLVPDIIPALACPLDPSRDSSLECSLDCYRDPDHDRIIDCVLFPILECALDSVSSHASDRALDRTFDRAFSRILDSELKQVLQSLKQQLPHPDTSGTIKEQWWRENYQAWVKELRYLMIQYRNIGHDWRFNREQNEALKRYYAANLLLLECLNSDCYVSREVRQHIEDTLLLPTIAIEQAPTKRVVA